NEINTQVIEFFKRTEQMADAAGESIEPGHDNNIKLPCACVFHQSIKRGPGILRTANSFISIFFDYFKTSALCVFAQCESLGFRSLALALCSNPHVESTDGPKAIAVCVLDASSNAVHSAPPCTGRSMPALRILSAAAKIRCALRSEIVAPANQF